MGKKVWCKCKVVAFMTFLLPSPSSVLKVPNCFTQWMKLMAINQAFLCTFYVRCSFRKPFESLSDTTSLQDARTFSSTALNFSRVALSVHWLKERPLNLIFLNCMLLLVYCSTGTPATRPFWKMRLKTRQEWYQVGNGDLHHHLGQMWYCGLFLLLLNFVRVVPGCSYKGSI